MLLGTQIDNVQANLNLAFLAVKDSIIKLRNGDTLVRSLNFSSPEEEYRYDSDALANYRVAVLILSTVAAISLVVIVLLLIFR